MELYVFQSVHHSDWNDTLFHATTVAPKNTSIPSTLALMSPFNVSPEISANFQRNNTCYRGRTGSPRNTQRRFMRSGSRNRITRDRSPLNRSKCAINGLQCVKLGRYPRECWINTANAGRNTSPSRPQYRPINTSRNTRDAHCFKCKNVGHFANQCPETWQSSSQAQASTTNTSSRSTGSLQHGNISVN